ncbi:uncharacterized protein LOC123668870 [Melitaea cinxia]|uniref:uncharacterized protein LOC123658632 n=1 Tax=Melitaea cinxia TaxID=113334 RepID=UPI001E26FF49|nr:uncharacterized protein LOC123658632 [Melitaea cinxia]XP_045455778.1 uncharacterized protein LOC123665531 [Melitaea cinxia]XP_045458517.1 uncharacterized protein LOC123668870 [Melitaea cinxia]
MEVRSDLATGHARTANARTRMQNGWTEIATVLNSVGNGCIKEWKQWAKYWKDKKAATKRKANIAQTAMQRTGGGVDVDVVELSDLEKRILTISGGLSFATGDRNLAINPFHVCI